MSHAAPHLLCLLEHIPLGPVHLRQKMWKHSGCMGRGEEEGQEGGREGGGERGGGERGGGENGQSIQQKCSKNQ